MHHASRCILLYTLTCFIEAFDRRVDVSFLRAALICGVFARHFQSFNSEHSWQRLCHALSTWTWRHLFEECSVLLEGYCFGGQKFPEISRNRHTKEQLRSCTSTTCDRLGIVRVLEGPVVLHPTLHVATISTLLARLILNYFDPGSHWCSDCS